MKEENNKEEFRKIAPKLKQLLDKEEAKAELPKDYFQNFEARLQQRLATEESLEPAIPNNANVQWGIKGTYIWKYLMALAVPALLILLWLRWPTALVTPASINFATVSSQEIDQYMEEHLEIVTVMDLVAMAETEVLDQWEEGIVPVIEPVVLSSPTKVDVLPNQSLDKALERTQNDDLLDELTTEDLQMEEDWF